MQKLGRKSIVVEVILPNRSNPLNPHIVKVHANKNHGICDIILGSKIPVEVTDERTQKKRTIMKFVATRHLNEVLSAFQGRQYNNPEVFESLENVLSETINPE